MVNKLFISTKSFIRKQTRLALRESVLSTAMVLATGAAAADIKLIIEGVRDAQGQLMVSVHSSASTWGEDDDVRQGIPTGITRFIKVPVTEANKTMEVTVSDLAPGRYALGVYHDLNGDNKFNRMIYPFIGMPSEPYVLSNSNYHWFSRPTFEESAFDLPDAGLEMRLRLSTHLEKMGRSPD